MRDITDFRDEVMSDLKVAFPRHTIGVDADLEAFNVDCGDVYLSLTFYITEYGSLGYRAWAGDTWKNLEQVNTDTTSRAQAILWLLSEYNTPRPTINDLVKAQAEDNL